MSFCHPTMQLEAAKRRYGELHQERPYHNGVTDETGAFIEWAKEPSLEFRFHYSDGATIWLSREDLTPDHDFLGQKPPPSVDPSE